MLNKLIKYEFKAQSRLLLPIILAIIGGGVLESVLMTVMNRMPYMDSPMGQLMENTASGLMVLLILAMFAASFVVVFLLVQRFYKNLFTDEGYLTFTLPVTADQLLITKLISAFVWSVAAAVAFIIAVTCIILFGTADHGLINMEALREIFTVFRDIWDSLLTIYGIEAIAPYVVEFLLLLIFSVLSSYMLFYYAIAQGCSATRKNRILLSIGIYFAANVVISIVRNVLSVITLLSYASLSYLDDWEEFTRGIDSFLHLNLWISILCSAAALAVGYLLTRRLLKKKLNLE